MAGHHPDSYPLTHHLFPIHLLTPPFIHKKHRYTKLANWDYVRTAAQAQGPSLPRLPVIGNGDVLSWTDHEAHKVCLF